jgi:hypothetical protein
VFFAFMLHDWFGRVVLFQVLNGHVSAFFFSPTSCAICYLDSRTCRLAPSGITVSFIKRTKHLEIKQTRNRASFQLWNCDWTSIN